VLHGNLLCGVMGGRSSRSWMLVPGASVAGDAELTRWIGRAAEFVSTMPPKPSK